MESKYLTMRMTIILIDLKLLKILIIKKCFFKFLVEKMIHGMTLNKVQNNLLIEQIL